MKDMLDLEFDFDVLAFASYGVAGDVSRGRRAEYRSACDVEDGAVPRAGHFSAHNHSLRERPAPVSTGIVNRIERSIDIEERYSFPPASTRRASPRAMSPIMATLMNSPIRAPPLLLLIILLLRAADVTSWRSRVLLRRVAE